MEGLIRHGAEQFTVFGTVVKDDGAESGIPVGMERSVRGVRARIAGRDVKAVAELAELMPLAVVNADSQGLLEEGPQVRRQFLDWGVFHVEPLFLGAWTRYQRALRQRNALLRNGAAAALAVWDAELVPPAEQIDHFREIHVRHVLDTIDLYLQPLTGLGGLGIEYVRGWTPKESLPDVLKRSVARDRRLQYTQFGPHRADLLFRIGRRDAREFLSRGQQKALAIALRLAQVSAVQRATGKRCVVLVDDLAAELDAHHRESLLRLLKDLDVQAFVTTVEATSISAPWWPARKMFHVEHGRVAEVIY